ncbi:MAG: hypothetical protein GC179_00890 [Anaerolineaceae bacterium]|nr:hypothetical protein [Anaerolineaceae bacterium]
MPDSKLENSWNAFCKANGFVRFDVVPKEYEGQKALSLEIEWDRIDALLVRPTHPLDEFGLTVLSDPEQHNIKADEALIYIGSKRSTSIA